MSHTEVKYVPIRDGATIQRERMGMIIQLVKINPGISIETIRREIAYRTGLNRKTVSRYVRELTEVGRLVRTDEGFEVAKSTPTK